jgi:predicted nucleic acid-binding protein
MSVDYFIDTNVFIYPLESLDARKADKAERLIEKGIATGKACISFQVVQECLNTAIRKAEIPLTTDEMKRYLNSVLMPLYRVQPSLNLYHAALDIKTRYRFGFYDSLIVAAALESGCKTLYSEDLQHGQQIEGLTIENPFQD